MRSEFEFIRNIKEKYALRRVGDDCAVLPKDSATDLVITTDLLIEGVDFRLDWTSADLLGRKAIAVSLSDLAAMGAKPTHAMLSIGIPECHWRTKLIDEFYEGWFAVANDHGVELIGGDVSRSPDKIVIDSIVLGEVEKDGAITRSGAHAEDLIFVSGSLGGAAGGLALLESGVRYETADDPSRELLERQLAPRARIDLGLYLSENRLATAMIDISDGFSSDLAHLCESSRVGAIITDVPIDPLLRKHFSAEEAIEKALHGGEDFELLITIPEGRVSELDPYNVTLVGVITGEQGRIVLRENGNEAKLEPGGFQHF